jgi:two-component system sensor histidine kinase BarA
MQEAWDLNHKLYGTFCFYDFADCLELVESLQKALEQADAEQAWRGFEALKINLQWLLDNQNLILQRLIPVDHS